jgi:hypothetical protein
MDTITLRRLRLGLDLTEHWFVASRVSAIGRITTQRNVALYRLPPFPHTDADEYWNLRSITLGPNGVLWVGNGKNIVRAYVRFGQTATTTELTSSLNPAPFGSAVMFAAVVRSVTGTPPTARPSPSGMGYALGNCPLEKRDCSVDEFVAFIWYIDNHCIVRGRRPFWREYFSGSAASSEPRCESRNLHPPGFQRKSFYLRPASDF